MLKQEIKAFSLWTRVRLNIRITQKGYSKLYSVPCFSFFVFIFFCFCFFFLFFIFNFISSDGTHMRWSEHSRGSETFIFHFIRSNLCWKNLPNCLNTCYLLFFGKFSSDLFFSLIDFSCFFYFFFFFTRAQKLRKSHLFCLSIHFKYCRPLTLLLAISVQFTALSSKDQFSINIRFEISARTNYNFR